MFNKLWLYLFSFLPVCLQATPDVSLNIHRFHSAGNSFAEISIYIVGNSLRCDSLTGGYGVEYMIIIKDTMDHVITGNRYRLNSTGCPAKDLIDVKRFALPPGHYIVDAEVTDVNDPSDALSVMQEFMMEKDAASPHISDIQLFSVVKPESEVVSPLHKHGLYLEPLPFAFYYPALDRIHSYIEAYHTDKLEGQPYMQYTIKPLSGDVPEPIIAHRKVIRQEVAVNLFQLDIKTLISGPYIFEAALFDGNKKMITSTSTLFSRYNPQADSIFIASGSMNLETSFISKIPQDSLDYHLKAMAPIVSSVHIDIMNALLQKGSAKSKQFFIHRYWSEQAGKFADQAFASYMSVAKIVDKMYRSGFGYGFETDRGHVFLKYGRPDDIIEVEDEPSAPPYEIWYYNQFPATHQNNVRFLFYNPSLATNAFTLLHSTAIGEVRNDRWEVELYKDATLEAPAVDQKVMGDNVHRNARKYFENY